MQPDSSVSMIRVYGSIRPYKEKKNIHGFGPLANYADRAIADSWRSSTNFCG
jgi:hypothetical protein